MTKRQMPPARNSNALVLVVKPSGPHHCARYLGSVHCCHTSLRGASNTRVPMIERGSRSRSILFVALTFLLLVTAGLSDNRRDDRAAPPRAGDTRRASRRPA